MSATESQPRYVVSRVDDQQIVAEALRAMLANEGDIELHACTDVALALQLARKVRPTVILQDLEMPGFDGFTLVRREAQLESANRDRVASAAPPAA